ncbi:MAG: hypothetical protein AABY10_02780 [Nanoarchaeota archaeon]
MVNRKEYLKDYEMRNKEKIAKRKKRYYELNKGRLLQQKKEYRRLNPEKIKQSWKEYYQDNKEVILSYHKEYKQTNKDRIKERGKEYALKIRKRDDFFEPKNKIKQVHSTSKNIGLNNGMWKGDNVGYIALHSWIKARKPKPLNCGHCNVRTNLLDLANISQEYKREVIDWEYLCRRCHMNKDGRINKLLVGLNKQ